MFDHLTGHKEEASGDSLKKITELAALHEELEAEYKLLEAQAKEAKKKFLKVSQEYLPQALMDAGINNFELANGRKVGYKEELTCSIKDIDKLVKFLEDRGDDAIVKVNFDTGKLPQNIVNRIMKDFNDNYGILAEVKTTVHPMTLKSYFTGLLGLKKNSIAEMTIGEVDQDMVNIFTYYKTTVK